MIYTFFIYFIVLFYIPSCMSEGYSAQFTPPQGGTIGQPWPMPQYYKPTSSVQKLNRFDFHFNNLGQTCTILDAAIDRYFDVIFYPGRGVKRMRRDTTLRFQPTDQLTDVPELTSITVNLMADCEEWPSLGMDEKYQLTVTTADAKLIASSVWGILRGLETFSQIIYEDGFGNLLVNNTVIEDYPRFSHRGILLDTARHYLPKGAIFANLEAMAYNKMNVFHWHIVDDQSFPYQSRDYPHITEMGAYDPYTHIYSQEDVKEIMEFARVRGIRVVPEFDSPGHSQSWGRGQADLLTPCYSGGKADGSTGPINPIVDSTYTFLQGFMKELSEVFQDKYLHLGGDEVSFNCWKSNPDITQFMTKMNISGDYSKLEQYYMQKLLDIVGDLKKGYIIWQEVFDNGVKVQPDTVVHVWKGKYSNELAKVTAAGYSALLSSPWYLSQIHLGYDWIDYYKADPHNFNGTADEKALVMGGEACLWGEWVDATNVVSRLWPRASAIAERLWSAESVNNTDTATPRLKEHRCRMIRRGINAEPGNGPSFCQYEAGMYIY